MRLRLHHKLSLLIVTLLVAVVGFLATFLSSRQIDTMTAALHRKVATYGSVMAEGARSAVAFSDRETAREVLAPITEDHEVASVALYGSDGQPLFQHGTLELAIANDTRARIVDTSSRVAAVAPVVSLEGPRGVLVIELSTESLAEARRRVTMLALGMGAAAVTSGLLVAWLLSRRLARRLRTITDAAAALANGDLDQPPIGDRGSDEINVLATAFEMMLARIKRLLDRVKSMARQEQERLEALVAERTEALDRRNAEMQLVFDHVDQGLLIVNANGKVVGERSAAVERYLGPIPASTDFVEYVRQFAPVWADWVDLQWEGLRDGSMPVDICLAQLPSAIELEGRHLELAYKSLVGSRGEPRVLIVVTDVTARVERDRAERDERETSSLLSRLMHGRAGFLAFYRETSEYIAELGDSTLDDVALRRTVHTLKGICATSGVQSISELCHALETAIEDGDADTCAKLGARILERWHLLAEKIGPLVDVTANRVEVLDEDTQRFEAAVAHDATRSELIDLVRSWRQERVHAHLTRLADDAHVLADRLGKGPIEVHVDADPTLRLSHLDGSSFWSGFVHALRNTVDHGIETPEERAERGKPHTAALYLRAHQHLDRITIEIEDRGRGIDWERVAEVARDRGLPTRSADDLVDALFADGISTRTEVSATSGRGIGLAALRHACEQTGGKVRVRSVLGHGTTFAFEWLQPMHVMSHTPEAATPIAVA